MGAKLSGSSGKKYEIAQNSEINVTPFVDVMLVLLIIFMVAAPLATQSLHLDIPPAIPPNPNDPIPPKPALVQIVANGDLYVGLMDQDGVKVTPGDMVGTITRTFDTNHTPEADRKVFIKAVPDVEYGTFMDVMNTLESSGYDKVGLVTEDFKENQ